MDNLLGEGPLKLAIILNPDLPVGLIANTAAVISIGLGAAEPRLGAVKLSDRSGFGYRSSADRPVPILQATHTELQSLSKRANKTKNGDDQASTMVLFPAFARRLHSFSDYMDALPQCDIGEEDLDGIGLVGPEKWVKSLTGNLKLLR